MRYLLMAAVLVLITGCTSQPRGRLCDGEVSSLYGQNLGRSNAWVFDQVNYFTVSKNAVRINSGPLISADRQLYIPAAVTAEGYYAQRLGDNRFRLINSPQNLMVTWTCPAPGTE
ncbi:MULTISPECIES: hypothetical protein [Tatumella]|uniref:C-type lysozyme inhibitor domain-containing protein n=1 Tax=Tatumella punctata TaxID=399969 RepID=A0ABW1VS40_9GAMM|nr:MULTISPECIES: hypothetical protein [unclassified Tatumella]MBS0856006.1 hypothetical protein [Tatumella sp. JGM16]MBS0878065.1 hypothetical protein [Tatumella sp. JGM82]MBS0890424.1 hypothetical protein [Tatumella sp. JGM94]MBS0894687.1 hypothetical protein [Tatumella sp. JGM130]MBS0900880.1 hypothetical protein [Tatumella sp. JGM100]